MLGSSSSQPSTSLQRALESSTAKVGTTISDDARNPAKEVGAFESCFASGLDLSEFAASSSAPNCKTATKSSAASELLRIKQAEKQQRENDEREDYKMDLLVQRRLHKLRNGAKSDDPNTLVVNALVQMHGGDETYKTTSSRSMQKSRQRRRSASQMLQQQQSLRRNGANGKKKPKGVVKKGKRSKF